MAWYLEREHDRIVRSRRSQQLQYRVAGAAIQVGREPSPRPRARLLGRLRGWRGANLSAMATLYRCKAPTNRVCRCGKVARRLDAAGIEYDEVRVANRRARPPRDRGAHPADLGAGADPRRRGHLRLAPDPRVPGLARGQRRVPAQARRPRCPNSSSKMVPARPRPAGRAPGPTCCSRGSAGRPSPRRRRRSTSERARELAREGQGRSREVRAAGRAADRRQEARAASCLATEPGYCRLFSRPIGPCCCWTIGPLLGRPRRPPASRRRAARPARRVSYISVTMSQPPTSSPFTKSWGMVGQPDSAESSSRMRGSGRMSSAAYFTPSALSAPGGAQGEAAGGSLGRALHEEHHLVLLDRLIEEVADLGVVHWAPPGVEVLIERAWMAPPTSAPNTS